MIRTTNVRDGFIDLASTRCVDEATFHRWTRRQLPLPGDVVLTREAPLGEVGIIRAGVKVFLGQRLVSYRTNPALLDNRYLLYYLRSPGGRSQVQSFGMGATVAHMRVPDAKRLLVPVPPIAEQRRIASILGAYDDLIEVNRRRIAALEAMARGLFEEWFVRFRCPGHGVAQGEQAHSTDLPIGWRLCELSEVLALYYGKALKADIRVDGSTRVIGSSGVVGTHNVALVAGPAIILGRKGNVGSVIWSQHECWPIDTVFVVNSAKPLTYLYELLKKIPFQNTDAAVPGLNRTAALKKQVVCPPDALMERFNSMGRPMRDLREKLEASNVALATARDLLLPRLISGELSVAAAERETEAAVTASAETFHTLKQGRRDAIAAADLTADEAALIAAARIPAEHRYSVDDA